MKKHLGNLFIVITSFIFVIVLFGCLSINSKAATKLQPAKDVKFVDDHYHYRAASTGYYTVLMSRKTTNYTSWYLLETNRSRDKGDIVNNEISRIYPYSKGKVTLYVICHPTLKDYETKDGIEPYERDKTCKIAKSKVANVTKQMSMVTDLQVKPATDDAHKNMYRVSWNPDGAAHKVFIRTSYGGGASIVGRETNCVYVNMTSYDREIQIMTLSTNLATTADSEVKSIYAPAVDPNILYNIGAFTIDLRNGPVTLTDPVCLEALGGILSSTRFEVVEDGTKQGESYYVVYVDLDKDGSMDVSFYEGTDFSTVTLLPTNSIKDQLTLTIDEAGLKWAIKSEYKYYSQLTVLVPKAPEPSYSDPGTIPTIDGKPVDAGSISQVITVDGRCRVCARYGHHLHNRCKQ